MLSHEVFFLSYGVACCTYPVISFGFDLSITVGHLIFGRTALILLGIKLKADVCNLSLSILIIALSRNLTKFEEPGSYLPSPWIRSALFTEILDRVSGLHSLQSVNLGITKARLTCMLSLSGLHDLYNLSWFGVCLESILIVYHEFSEQKAWGEVAQQSRKRL